MNGRRDPEPELGGAQRELEDRLERHRPVPAPGFRGTLGRHLADLDPGYGPRPARLVPLVAACLSGGLVLVGLSALTATGSL